VAPAEGDPAVAGGTFSVEAPLWKAVSAFRTLTTLYAVSRYLGDDEHYAHPGLAWIYMVLLTAWTLGTMRIFASKRRCTSAWLQADLVVVILGIVLTRLLDHSVYVDAGEVTLPTIRAAATVLGWSVKSGWRQAAASAFVIGLANIYERGAVSGGNIHSIVLLMLSGVAIGYVIEIARASEATLARALEIQAATRERERLARDIHDSVLQVLAMVQRRGTELGGGAEEIGRMAGEQEIALRTLVAEGLVPNPSYEAPRRPGRAPAPGADQDLRSLLTPLAGSRVTLSAPGTPVLLAGHAAREVSAAVAAAVDNVRQHAGERARTWILVEEEPDAVVVSVRDDGPGFTVDRLDEAVREGRLGVSQSIKGRLHDLGGSTEIISAPGEGTEVELRLPRQRAGG
jgi:signal transduction histidine kinase